MTFQTGPEWDDPKIRKRLQNRCSTYGIQVEDFREMWTEQGGRCAICRSALTLRGARIDHYHDIDRDLPDRRAECVRGLLCQGCNTVLPQYEDATEDAIQRQISMLEEDVREAHRRLDDYLRARPLYLQAVAAYLAGAPVEIADEDSDLLLAGRRLPWRDSNWASPGFDIGEGRTIEFSDRVPVTDA